MTTPFLSSVQPFAASIPLYALAGEYESIAAEMVDLQGELTPELEARLDAIEDAFDGKVERTALLIRNLTGLAEAANTEAERLNALASARLAAAKRLKEYVKAAMEVADRPKVVTPLVTARIQNSPASAKWSGDPQNPPEGYTRTRVEFDARKALDDHKAGVALPDGVSVTQGTHLVLK